MGVPDRIEFTQAAITDKNVYLVLQSDSFLSVKPSLLKLDRNLTTSKSIFLPEDAISLRSSSDGQVIGTTKNLFFKVMNDDQVITKKIPNTTSIKDVQGYGKQLIALVTIANPHITNQLAFSNDDGETWNLHSLRGGAERISGFHISNGKVYAVS